MESPEKTKVEIQNTDKDAQLANECRVLLSLFSAKAEEDFGLYIHDFFRRQMVLDQMNAEQKQVIDDLVQQHKMKLQAVIEFSEKRTQYLDSILKKREKLMKLGVTDIIYPTDFEDFVNLIEYALPNFKFCIEKDVIGNKINEIIRDNNLKAIDPALGSMVDHWHRQFDRFYAEDILKQYSLLHKVEPMEIKLSSQLQREFRRLAGNGIPYALFMAKHNQEISDDDNLEQSEDLGNSGLVNNGSLIELRSNNDPLDNLFQYGAADETPGNNDQADDGVEEINAALDDPFGAQSNNVLANVSNNVLDVDYLDISYLTADHSVDQSNNVSNNVLDISHLTADHSVAPANVDHSSEPLDIGHSVDQSVNVLNNGHSSDPFGADHSNETPSGNQPNTIPFERNPFNVQATSTPSGNDSFPAQATGNHSNEPFPAQATSTPFGNDPFNAQATGNQPNMIPFERNPSDVQAPFARVPANDRLVHNPLGNTEVADALLNNELFESADSGNDQADVDPFTNANGSRIQNINIEVLNEMDDFVIENNVSNVPPLESSRAQNTETPSGSNALNSVRPFFQILGIPTGSNALTGDHSLSEQNSVNANHHSFGDQNPLNANRTNGFSFGSNALTGDHSLSEQNSLNANRNNGFSFSRSRPAFESIDRSDDPLRTDNHSSDPSRTDNLGLWNGDQSNNLGLWNDDQDPFDANENTGPSFGRQDFSNENQFSTGRAFNKPNFNRSSFDSSIREFKDSDSDQSSSLLRRNRPSFNGRSDEHYRPSNSRAYQMDDAPATSAQNNDPLSSIINLKELSSRESSDQASQHSFENNQAPSVLARMSIGNPSLSSEDSKPKILKLIKIRSSDDSDQESLNEFSSFGKKRSKFGNVYYGRNGSKDFPKNSRRDFRKNSRRDFRKKSRRDFRTGTSSDESKDENQGLLFGAPIINAPDSEESERSSSDDDVLGFLVQTSGADKKTRAQGLASLSAQWNTRNVAGSAIAYEDIPKTRARRLSNESVPLSNGSVSFSTDRSFANEYRSKERQLVPFVAKTHEYKQKKEPKPFFKNPIEHFPTTLDTCCVWNEQKTSNLADVIKIIESNNDPIIKDLNVQKVIKKEQIKVRKYKPVFANLRQVCSVLKAPTEKPIDVQALKRKLDSVFSELESDSEYVAAKRLFLSAFGSMEELTPKSFRRLLLKYGSKKLTVDQYVAVIEFVKSLHRAHARARNDIENDIDFQEIADVAAFANLV